MSKDSKRKVIFSNIFRDYFDCFFWPIFRYCFYFFAVCVWTNYMSSLMDYARSCGGNGTVWERVIHFEDLLGEHFKKCNTFRVPPWERVKHFEGNTFSGHLRSLNFEGICLFCCSCSYFAAYLVKGAMQETTEGGVSWKPFANGGLVPWHQKVLQRLRAAMTCGLCLLPAQNKNARTAVDTEWMAAFAPFFDKVVLVAKNLVLSSKEMRSLCKRFSYLVASGIVHRVSLFLVLCSVAFEPNCFCTPMTFRVRSCSQRLDYSKIKGEVFL